MRARWSLVLATALALAACGDDDDKDDPPAVRNFGAAPLTACPNPEGVAVDTDGNVWTASAPGAGGAAATTAKVCRLNPDGTVFATIEIQAGASGAVNFGGLYFAPGDGLYVTDFGDFGPGANKRLLRVDPTTAGGTVTTIASDFTSPNAITRDDDGNLYVSDSAVGAIYRIANDAGRTKTLWKQDALLTTDNAQLPFGANGIAFDAARTFLYVANTGEATITRIARNADGSAGAATTFASNATLGGNALAGADGIAFDTAGNLYVCANQANEIQVLSTTGTPAITQRFAGEGADAFIFPASIWFRGNQAYVANLSFGAAGGKLSILDAPTAGLALP